MPSNTERQGCQGPGKPGAALYILFPVTLYVLIGTLILFLCTKQLALAQALAVYADVKWIKNEPLKDYHKESPAWTLAFPFVGPIIFLYTTTCFVCALSAAFFVWIYRLLRRMWSWVVDVVDRIWKWLVDAVERIWMWIVQSIERIWRWTVDFVNRIWEALSRAITEIVHAVSNLFE